MVSLIFTYNRQDLGKIASDITALPDAVFDFVEKDLPRLIEPDLVPLKTEPPAPKLPFIWSYNPVINAQKRREYFKTLPKGSRGGRYIRTHKLVQSWKTQTYRSPNEAVISVSNNTPYIETVQGDEQYPSHKDSGWALYDPVFDTVTEKAIDAVTEKFFEVFK